MPVFKKSPPGNVCWVEANLENPEKGKVFYSELFGWKSEDVKMPVGDYTMMKLGDDTVAGILKLPENAKKMGAPSHWLCYVAVEDVVAHTKKAESLGGKVLFGPEGVGPGKMSVIQDPTGAVLALWQSVEPMGTFLWAETNSASWVELTTKDQAAATKFYSELFGWTTESFPMSEFGYTVAKNGDVQLAGIMPQPKAMVEAKAPSLWTVYFSVADCDATADRAKKLGGKIVHPPTDIPSVGRFAILEDSDGAAFAILKSAPRS